MLSENVVTTDVLVIGGGTAGCFAAIKAREQGLDVTIVDKAYAGKSGSSIAASGWWSVFNPDWGMNFDDSMNALNKNGEYINNREWTKIMLDDSWGTYEDLVAWGVEFPVAPDEMKDFLRTQIIRSKEKWQIHKLNEPFGLLPLRHRKVTPVLRRQAEKIGVKIMDRIMITDLVKQDGNVAGAIGFALASFDLYIFKAKATILCGGMNSFRPPGMHKSCVTGDADGMAYRAGAEIGGKEFPDMHFSLANYPAWKGTGELYPAYFYLTDAEGERVPAMGMDLTMVSTIDVGKGPVLWDFDAADPDDIEAMRAYTRKRANPVELERIRLDPSGGGKYQIIGGAAAGGSEEQAAGIWPINTQCASSLPGLYAAGDCCCTWCWGAIVRGAPWGLMPAAVTGKRAGAGAAAYASQISNLQVDGGELARLKKVVYAPADRKGGLSPRWVTQLLQNTMMPYFILHIKHGQRLQAAITLVEYLRDRMVPKMVANDPHELRLAHETKNMVVNAEMILKSSLFRTESRGHHFREDYPQKDDPGWLAWTKIQEEGGNMKLSKVPVPKE